jgi:hypothetical protein
MVECINGHTRLRNLHPWHRCGQPGRRYYRRSLTAAPKKGGGGRKREMRLGFHWINIFVACTTNESHPSQTDGSDRVVSLDQAITTAFGPIAHVGDHEVLAGSSQIWPATVRWNKFQPALPMDLRRSPINWLFLLENYIKLLINSWQCLWINRTNKKFIQGF